MKRLNGDGGDARKTQTTEYHVDMADTPGEFVEHWYFQRALQGMAAGFRRIAFVLACNAKGNHYPPNFASSFGGKECIGIITKIDSAEEGSIQKAREVLQKAGVKKIFETSSVSGDGIEALREYIKAIE